MFIIPVVEEYKNEPRESRPKETKEKARFGENGNAQAVAAHPAEEFQ